MTQTKKASPSVEQPGSALGPIVAKGGAIATAQDEQGSLGVQQTRMALHAFSMPVRGLTASSWTRTLKAVGAIS